MSPEGIKGEEKKALNEELYEKISATLTALTTGGEDNA